MLSLGGLRAILEDVHFPDYAFRTDRMGDGCYLQVCYAEPDVESGEPREQRGRKWYISPHAGVGEAVQTALKAVLTSAEHRVREHFTYRGARVFGPHFRLDDLVDLCERGALEKRP